MQTVTVEPIKNALTGRDFVCKRSAHSSSPKCDTRCDIQGTGTPYAGEAGILLHIFGKIIINVSTNVNNSPFSNRFCHYHIPHVGKTLHINFR